MDVQNVKRVEKSRELANEDSWSEESRDVKSEESKSKDVTRLGKSRHVCIYIYILVDSNDVYT